MSVVIDYDEILKNTSEEFVEKLQKEVNSHFRDNSNDLIAEEIQGVKIDETLGYTVIVELKYSFIVVELFKGGSVIVDTIHKLPLKHIERYLEGRD